jgi:ribosomal protein S18 acetylase RimI-like enzyme
MSGWLEGCQTVPVDEADAIAVLSHIERAIPADQVLALYRAAQWWTERTPEQVDLVLQGSPAVGAWHDGQLIGFARAVTDGVLRAYVEDVIIAPTRRGSGIGKAVLDRLIEELGAIPVVTLFCSPDLVDYYEASSFRATRQVVMHRPSRN